MRGLFALAAFLSLCGCTTVESSADIYQHDDQLCQSYGAVPGSAAYANCRTATDNQALHQRECDDVGRFAAAAAMMAGTSGNAMTNIGESTKAGIEAKEECEAE